MKYDIIVCGSVHGPTIEKVPVEQIKVVVSQQYDTMTITELADLSEYIIPYDE